MISSRLADSLTAIAAVMSAALDDWWVISSAAVAVHGVNLGDPADVDVLLSYEDASRILPTLGIELRPGTDHPHFRSRILAIWREPPLPVEFMAGFEHRSGTVWRTVMPSTRQAFVSGVATVFVPGREDLRRMLLDFGRPKDLERARLLTR